MTFVNEQTQTIWVAGWQQAPTPPLARTGWVLPAGWSLTITVPDHWNGRFWGRTGAASTRPDGATARPVTAQDLPLYIDTTHSRAPDPISRNGCIPQGCTHAVVCPTALQVRADGHVVGCISACARLRNEQYCCQGPWSSRAACQPTRWPVDYAAVFKRAEPYAYSYVDDDATSVCTCSGGCDYRLVFGTTPSHRG